MLSPYLHFFKDQPSLHFRPKGFRREVIDPEIHTRVKHGSWYSEELSLKVIRNFRTFRNMNFCPCNIPQIYNRTEQSFHLPIKCVALIDVRINTPKYPLTIIYFSVWQIIHHP